MLQANDNEIDFCEPNLVSIQQSKIPGAGLGIIARTNIAHNTRFGPYVGQVIETLADAFISGYSWAVSTYYCYIISNVELFEFTDIQKW